MPKINKERSRVLHILLTTLGNIMAWHCLEIGFMPICTISPLAFILEKYKIINAIPTALEMAVKSLERWQNPNLTVQRPNSGGDAIH